MFHRWKEPGNPTVEWAAVKRVRLSSIAGRGLQRLVPFCETTTRSPKTATENAARICRPNSTGRTKLIRLQKAQRWSLNTSTWVSTGFPNDHSPHAKTESSHPAPGKPGDSSECPRQGHLKLDRGDRLSQARGSQKARTSKGPAGLGPPKAPLSKCTLARRFLEAQNSSRPSGLNSNRRTHSVSESRSRDSMMLSSAILDSVSAFRVADLSAAWEAGDSAIFRWNVRSLAGLPGENRSRIQTEPSEPRMSNRVAGCNAPGPRTRSCRYEATRRRFSKDVTTTQFAQLLTRNFSSVVNSNQPTSAVCGTSSTNSPRRRSQSWAL